MARRKKTRSKRSKKINVNLVDTATALLMGSAIIDSAEFLGTGKNASPELRKGAFGFALKDITSNLKNRTTQQFLIKTGASALIAKGVAKALRVRKIAGIGPLNLNV